MTIASVREVMKGIDNSGTFVLRVIIDENLISFNVIGKCAGDRLRNLY